MSLAQDAVLVVGALAKAARDISLMQVEVGKAAEPSGPGEYQYNLHFGQRHPQDLVVSQL